MDSFCVPIQTNFKIVCIMQQNGKWYYCDGHDDDDDDDR